MADRKTEAERKKLEKLIEQLWVWTLASERSADELRELHEHFDGGLDTLLNQDFFGTEGQTDPRGDHRD